MPKLHVRVYPNAARNQVSECLDGVWKIRITAPPVEGKANERLVTFLSTLFDVAKSNITILKGHSSRYKLLDVQGIEDDKMQQSLLVAMSGPGRL